jgi:predicted nucleic acid-binding protein
MELTLDTSTVVFLDTAPFIYFFEKHPRYYPPLANFFDRVYAAGAQMVTSIVTYIEIATEPARRGDTRLVAKYRDFLTHSENLSVHPISLAVADAAVRYRARHGLRTPDAVQLAVAETCGADYVLTNDAAWKKLRGVNVVLVSELGTG